jgi:hypothetical protein
MKKIETKRGRGKKLIEGEYWRTMEIERGVRVEIN